MASVFLNVFYGCSVLFGLVMCSMGLTGLSVVFLWFNGVFCFWVLYFLL